MESIKKTFDEPVESLILYLRGQKVMLDADLARLYGVQTRILNQAIKRNIERFPENIMCLFWLGNGS